MLTQVVEMYPLASLEFWCLSLESTTETIEKVSFIKEKYDVFFPSFFRLNAMVVKLYNMETT